MSLDRVGQRQYISTYSRSELVGNVMRTEELEQAAAIHAGELLFQEVRR